MESDHLCAIITGVPWSAVIRSDPILSDAYGRKFWKLKSYGEMDVLLQGICEFLTY